MPEFPIQHPYRQAYDMLQRASWSEMGDLLRRGIHMRIQRCGPMGGPFNWAEITEATVTLDEFTISVSEVLNRYRGTDTNLFRLEDLVYQRQQGWPRDRQYERAHCSEHLEAYQTLQNCPRDQLPRYQHQGILVQDPLYKGDRGRRWRENEEGATRVSVEEVLKARVALRSELTPDLLEFYHYVEHRRMERTVDDSLEELRTHQARIQRELLQSQLDAIMLQPNINWLTSNIFESGAERAEVIQKRREEISAAKSKALALLERVVSSQEFESFKSKGFIETFGKRFKYHVQKAGQTVIFDKKNGSRLFSSCLQLAGEAAYGAPQEDRVVMEYLLIRNDEERYLKTANLTSLQDLPGNGRYIGQNLGGRFDHIIPQGF